MQADYITFVFILTSIRFFTFTLFILATVNNVITPCFLAIK